MWRPIVEVMRKPNDLTTTSVYLSRSRFGVFERCLLDGHSFGIWKWASRWVGYWDNSYRKVSLLVCRDVWERAETSEETEKERPKNLIVGNEIMCSLSTVGGLPPKSELPFG